MEAPELDEFRDAVAVLHVDGALVGYLATKVEPMRAGFLLRRQERVWLLLTLLDGTQDVQEDYAPWSYLPDLRNGHIAWTGSSGDVDYKVRWLAGAEKQRAWARFGILEDVGAYRGGAQPA